jgi:hypothetical protein
MAGLDPAITRDAIFGAKSTTFEATARDRRVKPGDDECGVRPSSQSG